MSDHKSNSGTKETDCDNSYFEASIELYCKNVEKNAKNPSLYEMQDNIISATTNRKGWQAGRHDYNNANTIEELILHCRQHNVKEFATNDHKTWGNQ